MFVKVDRNTYRHKTGTSFEIRIYNAGGFYGADLWFKEDDFVSLCACHLRREVIDEVTDFIRECGENDIAEIYKKMYLNEYCKPFEMEEEN